jgi:hypothetical protein
MKKARATWFNVYLRPDGTYSRSLEQQTRKAAERQAALAKFDRRKTLYRVRVRRHLEPKT